MAKIKCSVCRSFYGDASFEQNNFSIGCDKNACVRVDNLFDR
jgi:hypothetical protein